MLRTEELSIPEYERSLLRTKKVDVISIALYHIQRVRDLEALLKKKESRPTVARVRALQQRKGKICPVCQGDKHLFQNGEFARKNCWRCKGTGRLRPVA
jgi:hypothetical protein